MKRPLNTAYWLNETPPLGVTVLSGLQHVGLVSIFLLVPVLACREAGLSPEKTVDVLALSMLVLAIGPLLQQWGRHGIGSGYLCPTITAAPYLPACMLALHAGGLPLMFGMTLFAGLVEMAVSRLLRPLRPYFPPEIAGFVVVMIGVTVGMLGFRSLLSHPVPGVAVQVSGPGFLSAAPLGIAAFTLAIMVALNVWTKGAARLFCALIGMGAGYLLAYLTGVLPAVELAHLHEVPWARLPDISHLQWDFDVNLMVPFAIAAIAASLRAMGDVTVCQKTNDEGWVRPDMNSISGGALANGLCTLLSGILGTVGANTSTSNVGLAAATGVTSRRVAFAIAGIYVLLAFVPMVAVVFVIMPGPVVGATLIFASCLIFINGLLIITSRMLDARRTFVIGLSFMLGVSVDIFPDVFAGLPQGVQWFTSSSLLLGTFCALILNMLFRVGARRKVSLQVDPSQHDPAAFEQFIESQGAAWGARRDVVNRVKFSLLQAVETLLAFHKVTGPLEVQAAFDEFSFDIEFRYTGAKLELPDARPAPEDIVASDAGEQRLAGFLLRRLADRVETEQQGNQSTVLFHFDH